MMVGGIWTQAGAQSLAAFQKNFFANSMAKWAQAGPGSNGSSTCANATAQWTNIDMVYVNNILGTNGVITTQQGGSMTGTENCVQAKITTAPTASQANGCELYWFIDDYSTAEIVDFFGGNAQVLTVSFLIEGLGNVTSIGIQPYYSSTLNTKPATSLSTEQTFTVNSSGPTQCTATFSISNGTLAVGDTMAFRIRIKGVSSGHVYDLNNGFQVGRAQCNYGSGAQLWAPYGGSWERDLDKCMRLYQKSAELGTNPQSGVNTGPFWMPMNNAGSGSDQCKFSLQFIRPLMQAPSMNTWDYSGNSGAYWYTNAAGAVTGNVTMPSPGTVSTKNAVWVLTLAASAVAIGFQWQADARPQN